MVFCVLFKGDGRAWMRAVADEADIVDVAIALGASEWIVMAEFSAPVGGTATFVEWDYVGESKTRAGSVTVQG